jgi:hypothetical protein
VLHDLIGSLTLSPQIFHALRTDFFAIASCFMFFLLGTKV